jgi:hypothetical protein
MHTASPMKPGCPFVIDASIWINSCVPLIQAAPELE